MGPKKMIQAYTILAGEKPNCWLDGFLRAFYARVIPQYYKYPLSLVISSQYRIQLFQNDHEPFAFEFQDLAEGGLSISFHCRFWSYRSVQTHLYAKIQIVTVSKVRSAPPSISLQRTSTCAPIAAALRIIVVLISASIWSFANVYVLYENALWILLPV